jgi:hypothetical protein
MHLHLARSHLLDLLAPRRTVTEMTHRRSNRLSTIRTRCAQTLHGLEPSNCLHIGLGLHNAHHRRTYQALMAHDCIVAPLLVVV